MSAFAAPRLLSSSDFAEGAAHDGKRDRRGADRTRIHSKLGPGLLEGPYELCLSHELRKSGLQVRNQVRLPLRYDELVIDLAYRIDLLIEDKVVVELKALETILPVHRAQLLSYLRLGAFKLGYILNFHVTHMRDGIIRLVNGL
jgi:GxxExxY protein